MLYCFFFFFKQKTAYEMRISDWSSDVCSSDLDEAGEEPAFAVGRMFGDISGGAAIFAAEREPLNEAEHDEQNRRRDADRGVAGQHAEIGSASCRERVCQ